MHKVSIACLCLFFTAIVIGGSYGFYRLVQRKDQRKIQECVEERFDIPTQGLIVYENIVEYHNIKNQTINCHFNEDSSYDTVGNIVTFYLNSKYQCSHTESECDGERVVINVILAILTGIILCCLILIIIG